MGSVITRAQAAKLLEVNDRTLRRYLREGKLRPVKTGTTHGVDEDDVIRLKKVNTTPAAVAFTHENFLKMWEDLQTVMTELATLKFLTNIRHVRWKMTDLQIKCIYEQAAILARDGWSPQVEEEWIDRFLSIHTDDFKQLEDLTGDAHPWAPFYFLCSCMLHTPFNPALKPRLAAGLHRLEQQSYTWAVIRGYSPRILDAIREDEASPYKRLIEKLRRQKHQDDGKTPQF